MSVLLTAVKKKQAQPKNSQPAVTSSLMRAVASRQGIPQPPRNPAPPLSNERTAIWYWRQGDTMMTAMLPRDTLQLWCNGISLDASSMLSNGDFAFELNQSNTGKGLEARMLAIRNPDGLTFALYVDGKFIPEHVAPAGGSN